MAINEWEIFRKYTKHPPEEKIDVDSDLDAIHYFVDTSQISLRKVILLVEKMQELRKLEKVLITETQKKDNLLKQAKIWDKLLSEFRFFAEDTDVNSARVKKIIKHIKKVAVALKIEDPFIKKLQEDNNWNFNW